MPLTNFSVIQGGLPTGQAAPIGQSPPNSPTSALDSNPYNTTVLKYPLDIGSGSIPSYVIFDIYSPLIAALTKVNNAGATQALQNSRSNLDLQNIQGFTSLTNGPLTSGNPLNGNFSVNGAVASGVAATAIDSAVRSFYSAWMANRAAGTSGSTISPLGQSGLGLVQGAASGALANYAAINLINLNPQLYRTSTSIMIYMPDTMKMDYEHGYDEVGATEAFGQVGLNSAMGKALADVPRVAKTQGLSRGLQGLAQSAYGREMITGILQEMGWLQQGADTLALKAAGYAVNPQTELLYKGTKNREFELTFMFQPRSIEEAVAIKNIINAFKINAAPSVNTQNSASGRYFIVPNQFDIRFMFQTSENQYVSKVSTSVLTSIQVNYSGSGEWVTMDDGAPASILLQLWFKEAEIMYRELLQQGGY